MKLTLEDLLRQSDLGLELVTGDAAVLDRPVAGAHSIEIARPSRWVPRDWIMLTNGLRLRGQADEQRRLVAELDENGQAALGWSVGLVHKRVPEAVIKEARARGFPVLVVPMEVPFREIISFVNGALLSDEVFLMRRVVSMQDHLMDALRVNDPEPVIIERLAGLLDADVVRFAPDGGVLHVVGTVPVDDLAPLISPRGDGMQERSLGARRVLALPVVTEDRAAGWVAVVLPERPPADRIVKPVLRSTAQLLGLVARARRIVASEGRVRRAGILGAALDDEADPATLDQHARELGMTFDDDAHAIAWGRAYGEPEMPGALADEIVLALEEAFAQARRPFLLAPRDGWLAGVVQAPLHDLAGPLLPERVQAAGVHTGIGRPIRSLADASKSIADARIALAHAARDGRNGVASFDDLDPASWLLAACDPEIAERKIAGLLDPLRSHEALLETLRCYFAADMNVAEAALALSLHRNTLRYRLARIEKILGVRLDSPRTIANVHMALLSDGLR